MTPLARSTTLAVVLALTVGAALPVEAARGPRANRDRAVAEFMERQDAADVPVIIKIVPGKTRDVADRLGRRGRNALKSLAFGKRLAARLSKAQIELLERTGLIEFVSYDAPVKALGQGLPLPPPPPEAYTLRSAVGAPSATTGSGLGVAVIDSGIAPVPGLLGRIAATYDFTGGTGAQPALPADPYGHGTHVAGIIGATLLNQYAGVAPDVHFVDLRVLDANGAGSTSHVIEAIDFAIANKDALGLRIVNLSLGHVIYESLVTDPLVHAVERASAAGLVVVVSAGNIGKHPETGVVGYGGITSPGNAPSAITVGAAQTFDSVIRSDDRVPDFSSRGPTWYDGLAKPDVVAPGVAVVSTMSPGSVLASYTQLHVVEGLDTYLKLSGTSMAAPVVSGVAALVIEASRQACADMTGSATACPAVTPNLVKAVLQYTATPLADAAGQPYDGLTQGRGMVNAAGAVDAVLAIDTRIDVGYPWQRWSVSGSTTFDGELHTWAQTIVWGTQIINGGVLSDNHTAWRTTVVWGTNGDTVVWGTGSAVVWGTNDTIVWGTFDDTIVWGTNIVWGQTLVWGTTVVWGTQLVGMNDGTTVVWGTCGDADTMVWGTVDPDTLVWGTSDEDTLVWGTGVVIEAASSVGLKR